MSQNIKKKKLMFGPHWDDMDFHLVSISIKQFKTKNGFLNSGNLNMRKWVCTEYRWRGMRPKNIAVYMC